MYPDCNARKVVCIRHAEDKKGVKKVKKLNKEFFEEKKSMIC